MIVRREYRFEASHQLPRHPAKCRRLHGHSYRFIIEVEGAIEAVQGMVIDFFDLDDIGERRVIARLDHRHIHDYLENPTAEWIAVWIYRQLAGEVPGLRSVELFEVESASALYRGELEREEP